MAGAFRNFIGNTVDRAFPGQNYVDGRISVSGRQLGLGLGGMALGLIGGPVAGQLGRIAANRLENRFATRDAQTPSNQVPLYYQDIQVPNVPYMPTTTQPSQNWLANPQPAVVSPQSQMPAVFNPTPNPGGLGAFAGGGGGFQGFSSGGGFGAGMGYGQGRGFVGSGVGSTGGGLGTGYGSLGGYGGIFGGGNTGGGGGSGTQETWDPIRAIFKTTASKG